MYFYPPEALDLLIHQYDVNGLLYSLTSHVHVRLLFVKRKTWSHFTYCDLKDAG